MKLRLYIYLSFFVALLMGATIMSANAAPPAQEPDTSHGFDKEGTSQTGTQATTTLPSAIVSSVGCVPPYGPWQTQTLLMTPTGRVYVLQRSSHDATNQTVHRLIFSDNLGYNWSDFASGLPMPSANVMNIDLDPQNPNGLYVETVSQYTYQNWYGFYQWSGNQWIGHSSQQVTNVAGAAAQPNTMWGTRGTQLVRTDNAGRSWLPMGSQPTVLGELYADPYQSGTLYVMSAAQIYRVSPNTTAWEMLPSPTNYGLTSMAMDQQTGHLYATSQAGSATLWRSVPSQAGQVSWEQMAHFNPMWQKVTLLAAGQSSQGLTVFVNATLVDGYSRTYRSVGPLYQGVWQEVSFQ